MRRLSERAARAGLTVSQAIRKMIERLK